MTDIEEKEKKCNNCSGILNDENKVKGKNKCKSCRNTQYKNYVQTTLTEQYKKDVERTCNKCSVKLTLENQVKNRPVCKACHNAKCNEYKKNNKDKVLANHKEYYEANKDDISEYYKNHYKDNKDTYMENNRKWRSNNKEAIRKKENERLHNNISLRLKKSCRTRIWYALKRVGPTKRRSLKLIDCDIDFLKAWLQSNFKEGMTFDNYGSYWHVDHVIPCSLFNLTIDDEINHCFKWTNLQPLEASLNISKQNTLDETEVIEHYKKVKKYATLHKIKLNDFDYKIYF